MPSSKASSTPTATATCSRSYADHRGPTYGYYLDRAIELGSEYGQFEVVTNIGFAA